MPIHVCIMLITSVLKALGWLKKGEEEKDNEEEKHPHFGWLLLCYLSVAGWQLLAVLLARAALTKGRKVLQNVKHLLLAELSSYNC